MLVGAAGIALLLLWPALLGLSVTLMLLASVQMVLLYRLGQPVVETGSALVSFIENLDIECRRSVREFTPLTVMYLGENTLVSESGRTGSGGIAGIGMPSWRSSCAIR